MRWFFLGLLILSACPGCNRGSSSDNDSGRIGPPTRPDDVDYVSGDRLRAQVYVSDNGTRIRHGWLDLQTNQSCSFQVTTDGEMRCVPNVGWFQFFADSDCATPVASSMTTPPLPFASAPVPGLACSVSVRALGELVNIDALYLKTESNPSVCGKLAELGTDSPMWVYSIPADLTLFVKAQNLREDRGGGLQAQYLVGSDGSRKTETAFDPAHNVRCGENATKASLANRCAPYTTSFIGEFSDPQCSSSVAAMYRCVPPGETSYVGIPTGDKCHPDLSAYRSLGAPVSEPVYAVLDGGCAQVVNDYASGHFATGPVLALTDLPGISRAHANGSGLVADWTKSSDGQHLLADRFFDTTAAAACWPVTTADCSVRCVPTQNNNAVAFLDPEFTKPVLTLPILKGCESPAPPAISMSQFSQFPPVCHANVFRVYRTGGKISPPDSLFYPGMTGSMQMPSETDYYEATEVLPSELPLLRALVE